MKWIYMYLFVLLFLLSGCAPVEDVIELDRRTTEAATLSPSPPTQIDNRTYTNSQLTPTVAATPTKSQPAPVETSTPTESQPTPVSPFTADSIGPGQQKAYSFQSSSGEEIIFWLYLPEDYDDSQSWPLIISLHGFLGFEPSLERVRQQSPIAFIGSKVEFPFIMISPQGPDGPWDTYHVPMEELIGLLGESLRIEPDAQFLTGLSAGAVGAWQWALTFPDRFTGLALIAGSPSSPRFELDPEATCRLRDLPIWIGHGEVDTLVPVEPTEAAIMALEDCGNTEVTFTVYKDLGHAKSFAAAFGGPELYDWMLAFIE